MSNQQQQLIELADRIRAWGLELGFQQVGITDIVLDAHEKHLQDWLEKGYQGDMAYMSKHGSKRSRPDELIPGTLRIISVRMDYLTEPDSAQPISLLDHPKDAYVSRYALGRDYHKVLRSRLGKLLRQTENYVEEHKLSYSGSRVFTDSAPVLEKAIAEKSGLGWIGKNTLLLNRQAGSWFFLGEIFTSLELPIETFKATNHCGSCDACIEICPTRALVAPYQLDARRCVSYLTIEYKGSIPLELRPLMGNRVFGCDDCQLVCPWNKYAKFTGEDDFQPRHGLDSVELLKLFSWSQDEFLKRTEGSAIRRAGYQGWLRNLSIALGNAAKDRRILKALVSKKEEGQTELLSEHLDWAIDQQEIS